MSRIGKIARRTFLVGSVAIAGGVAFGTYMVRRPHANPLEDGLANGEATFNPWVKISDEEITLITPHADVGQGVVWMQAMLIAEEMDLEPGQFVTDFGQPAAAYYNTAMADESVPFKSTDRSFQAEAMRTAMGSMLKLIGMQGTGGSSSVPDSFDKLRKAGAAARETLKLAASQETGIAVADLTTEAGAVVLPDGTRLAYTDLAARAATVEPVHDVVLRDPSQWRFIGKDTQRSDIVAKSTGTLDYEIDLQMDGMVYAALRLNPRKSPIKGFNAENARQRRGVKDIVEVTNGVAVIADNTWRAIMAATEIELDLEPAAYPAEQADHWEAVAASITDEHLDAEWRNDGAVEDALAQGEAVSAEYRAPYVAHQPMQPLGAVVKVTDTAVEVWTGHQMPRILQQQVALISGHDADQVILHNQYSGGSFGHRLELEHVKWAAEIANQMRGTPVKLTMSREEDFAQDFPRQISIARGTGTVSEGKVVCLDLQIASPSVLRSQTSRIGMSVPGPDTQIPAGAWNAPYALENFRVRAYAVSGVAPISSWRSVGASSAGFFIESTLDELIHAAGADPMAERIRLAGNDTTRKVLEAVAEMSDWGSDLGAGRGRGVAMVESFGVPTAEVVEVTDTGEGIKIDKVYVAADVGTIVDPVNFDNHIKGAVVWGLGHAMNCEITYSDGIPEQDNFHAAEGMRMYQCPEIIVQGLENADIIRGIGEPPIPPAAPALANAIFAATGTRLREMPFYKFIDFV
ncbi:xanthine dehydrogenase family protein molybdopterin-binding subunit [Oricola sp.]|uniref:xanthine dehydrogenase family protein molybdopterin-binding subunit n=1 Tax=Oricola sp. TaxID=1979950 RepID=UPI003BACD1F5